MLQASAGEGHGPRPTHVDFLSSWRCAWQGCGARGDGLDVERALLARYAEPRRRYHTVQHLAECLAYFELAQDLPPHPADVELAIWFHDAVYDPRRHDNEKLSAEWARHALSGAGAPAETAQRVSDLVMITRRHPENVVALDAQVLIDVDLAILGAAPARFTQYEQQIREEYAHLPIWTFRWKRAEVLRGMLNRQRIYNTPRFHDALEAIARENLRRSLET